MDYKEFSAKIKSKYPQYKDLDDRELAEKVIAKYPEYKNQVTIENLSPNIKKGIDITPSSLYKKAISYPAAGLRSIARDEDFHTALGKTRAAYEDFKPLHGTADFLFDTGVYSRLPMLKGASKAGKAKAFIGNALIQGGVPGAIEGLKEDNAIGGGVTGTGIAAGLQGGINLLPRIGKAAAPIFRNEKFQNAVAKGIEGLTSVPEKYSKLALQSELAGKSILNGPFDVETAYRPIEKDLRTAKSLLPQAEDFARRFYEVGQKAKKGLEEIEYKAGQDIRKSLNQLSPESINIGPLRQNVEDLINSYASGGEINPVLVRAGKDIEQVKKLLGSKTKEETTKALGDYVSNVRKNAGLESVLNKEQEDIAFSVLSQATGKNKNWLKSQLKANLPKMATQKRQEFIQNLLESADDKIENIDPMWTQYFPELTFDNAQAVGGGHKIATDMFDRIMGKNFRNNSILTPDELAYNEAEKLYANMLGDLVQNPGEVGYNNAYSAIKDVTKHLDNYGKELYLERLTNDIENIDNIVNPKVKPIDLHNIKEILYDIANYENSMGIRNNATKGIANEINSYLRNIDPKYADANDKFALIKNVEHDFGGPQGINANTIGSKLANYGSNSNIVSGLDNRLHNINQLLNPEHKFLNDTKTLVQNKEMVDNINRLIGSSAYERNPRLLANFTDEARETALNDLQKLTNIRFMDELENIRAREAFEKLTPGQGGGSGSTQGIQNLVRGGVTTSAAGLGGAMGGIPGAILAPALSLSAFSPKIMGKGTIKNIGNLYRNAENWQRLVPEEITRILSPALIQGIYGD